MGILEKKEKNEFGDTILIVKIHKDGSVLESRIENAIPKLQSIFGPIISKSNSPAKYYEVRLFLKQTDCREEIDITEEIEMDPKGSHSIKQHHINGIILVVPICYLRRIRFRKIKSSLWIDL